MVLAGKDMALGCHVSILRQNQSHNKQVIENIRKKSVVIRLHPFSLYRRPSSYFIQKMASFFNDKEVKEEAQLTLCLYAEIFYGTIGASTKVSPRRIKKLQGL